jgi:hypothetical protein
MRPGSERQVVLLGSGLSNGVRDPLYLYCLPLSWIDRSSVQQRTRHMALWLCVHLDSIPVAIAGTVYAVHTVSGIVKAASPRNGYSRSLHSMIFTHLVMQ